MDGTHDSDYKLLCFHILQICKVHALAILPLEHQASLPPRSQRCMGVLMKIRLLSRELEQGCRWLMCVEKENGLRCRGIGKPRRMLCEANLCRFVVSTLITQCFTCRSRHSARHMGVIGDNNTAARVQSAARYRLRTNRSISSSSFVGRYFK